MGLLRRFSRRFTLRYLRAARPAAQRTTAQRTTAQRTAAQRTAAAEMLAAADLLAAIRAWSREEPAPADADGPSVSGVHAELRAARPEPSGEA